MCAINPTHKKRFIIDVYTSVKMDKLRFEDEVVQSLLEAECKLNTRWPKLRFHLKETTEQAE